MGDLRFTKQLERFTESADPARELRRMDDASVIEALAAAARSHDPYLSNVLASEAGNRMFRAGAAMNSLNEGVLAVDLTWHVTFANRAAHEILGRGPGELENATIASIVPRGDTSHLLEHLRRTPGTPPWDVVELLRSDGTTFLARCACSRMEKDGVEIGAVAVFSDVTQEKAHERKERQRTALYKALLDTLGDLGLTVIVGDGARIVHASEAALRLLGYDPHEMESLPSAVALMDESYLPTLQAHLKDLDTRAELSPPFPVPLLTKDGRRVPASVRLRTLEVEGASYFVAFIETRQVQTGT